MPTLVDVLQRTEGFFRARGVPSPRLDAEHIFSAVLNIDRMALYLQFDRPMQERELDALRPLVQRRGERLPLAWVIGTQGFHTLDLVVHPGVLVPRPDTEALVEAALGLIPEDEDCYVADVGCGTGAVGLAIVTQRPRVRLYAIDANRAAIDNTRANVQRLGLQDRVAVLHGNWLEPIPADRAVDVVVSNPPYIATGTFPELEPEVRDHEPRSALDGGADGLDAYRNLIPSAALRIQRALAVEIGHDQGPAVRQLFEANGLHNLQVHPDLAERDRVVSGTAL
ncbi:MAG: peptide chain release factor N(5)-glutamine methyltransferase [Myxococcota bacterium]|nr:peptide chain release factor N(5)-glutamine methyltransferase [Myxococcota bacterium]